MTKLTQKWGVIALLEDVNDGMKFHFSDFPLHITLAGVFDVKKPGLYLATELENLLTQQKKFTVGTDTKDMFGPNKDVAVMKIKNSKDLLALHKKIYAWLLDIGAVYNDPHYQGDGYVPHSATQKFKALKENEICRINSVSLIDLFPDNDGYQRRVFKTIRFK